MLAPQGGAQPQAPNFAARQQAPAAAPSGSGKKPSAKGLVSAQAIDDRLDHMPREVQQAFIQAVGNMPDLPAIMGVAIGPEAQDYFAMMAQALQQQAQQNSQGAPQGDPSQNPQAAAPQGAPAGGQPPAMATPPAAPMA